MKGSVVMTRLSYGEQINVIAQILKEEIDKLNSLPADEAKKEARNGLRKVGIIDDEGNYTAPYVALGRQNVQ